MTSTRCHLRVLGPVTVRAAADPGTSSRITSPIQLGLLAYLAIARPRGLHSRDTLAVLFWPEQDGQRARRALRNALYGLRQQLGADAIASAGDHLVGLNPAHVTCDALDLERGELSRADFNDAAAPEPFHGLHVEGASGFDQWMSAERERLHGLAARRLASSRDTTRPEVAPASARRPHSADVWTLYSRGHYLFLRTAHGGAADDLLRSREYFERAHALDPAFAPAVAGLANFYAVAARRGVLSPFDETFAKAIACSEHALAMDDALAAPHVHLAVKALYLDDDWDRAGVEFARAVATEQEYAEAHRFHGVWLGMVGRHAEAREAMEIAALLEPDIPMMLSSLGAARMAAGDRAGAEAALRQTLAVEPRHAPARDRLIRLMEEEGRFSEAVAERSRESPLPGASEYREAFVSRGNEGYHEVNREALRAAAARLEPRVIELQAGQPPTANEVFAPPIVRLVALYAQLGDWKRVKSWRLAGAAARPALARWFDSIPELQSRRTAI